MNHCSMYGQNLGQYAHHGLGNSSFYEYEVSNATGDPISGIALSMAHMADYFNELEAKGKASSNSVSSNSTAPIVKQETQSSMSKRLYDYASKNWGIILIVIFLGILIFRK